MSLHVAFAGTPQFASEILKALLQSPHKVISVLTQPDRTAGRGQQLHSSPVKRLAAEYHIPCYQPESLKNSCIKPWLSEITPDVLIVVAYGLLIPKEILSWPKWGCINVHASLLPRWRGAAPIQQAILHGDLQTGITIMHMDPGLDTGDILLAKTCTIDATETSQSLHDKLIPLGQNALLQTLNCIETGNVISQQQGSVACYAPKISKNQAKINWHDSAEMIERKIRAFNPWPVAFTTLEHQPIRLWSAVVQPGTVTQAPGTVIRVEKTHLTVATGQGSLQLVEIQLPGGKRLPCSAILNSKKNYFQVGVQFN